MLRKCVPLRGAVVVLEETTAFSVIIRRLLETHKIHHAPKPNTTEGAEQSRNNHNHTDACENGAMSRNPKN
jgi:hypothetical protein